MSVSEEKIVCLVERKELLKCWADKPLMCVSCVKKKNIIHSKEKSNSAAGKLAVLVGCIKGNTELRL